MTEITLPCCETPTLVESLDGPIHCDGCGIDLELAVEPAEFSLARAA